MSEFSLSLGQRRRLLAEDYSPLVFDIKPHGCEPGARYVLGWAQPQAIDCGGGVVKRIPRHPVWFITVTSVVRRSAGGWAVRFDIHDYRDPTYFLKAGSGYTTSLKGAVDSRPVFVSDDVRAKTREEFWHQRRLAEFAQVRRERNRARRQRAA